DEHGKCLSSVRAGNVIGGGDWAEDRIVPDCIKALMNKENIVVRNPGSIRPWQFVLDPLLGYLLLAIKMRQSPLKYAGAWNFGPLSNSNISVSELVSLIIQEWGSGNWVTQSKRTTQNEFHESSYLKLDCTKAQNLLGWMPTYSLKEGVADTV
ncbi:MAG: CDP-glucose 4,6-dehydratase, partial [Thermoplasmata archaeon]